MNMSGFGGFSGSSFMQTPTTPMMFGSPFGQQNGQYQGGSAQYQGGNMNAAITNQKPKKVIYVDLNGNQKVFVAREDGQGYCEDFEDDRNKNANSVRPILDVENYDGFNYHPAPEQQDN